MARNIVRVLERDPELAFDFYCAASEIVDDFDDYGPALQATAEGSYDATTAVQRLRTARDRIVERLRAEHDS